MSKLDKDQVLSAFTEAYKNVNGKEPQIESKSGWYSIDGGKNVRLAAIEEMTAALTGGAVETAAEEPKAEEAPKKAPAKKAAAKKPAASAAKSSSKGYTVVKKGDGLNPANFWLDYLASLGTDSRTPHGFY